MSPAAPDVIAATVGPEPDRYAASAPANIAASIIGFTWHQHQKYIGIKISNTPVIALNVVCMYVLLLDCCAAVYLKHELMHLTYMMEMLGMLVFS